MAASVRLTDAGLLRRMLTVRGESALDVQLVHAAVGDFDAVFHDDDAVGVAVEFGEGVVLRRTVAPRPLSSRTTS